MRFSTPFKERDGLQELHPCLFVLLDVIWLAIFAIQIINHTKSLPEDEIMQEIEKYPAKHIVITGGEPTMQLSASLIYKMHEAKKYVQIETNGTLLLRDGLESMIDWITCSPKYKEVRIQRIDELKVVYRGQDMSQYDNLSTTYEDSYYLQPCDVKDKAKNAEILNKTINFIKTNSKWKLSLQTHKILNVR